MKRSALLLTLAGIALAAAVMAEPDRLAMTISRKGPHTVKRVVRAKRPAHAPTDNTRRIDPYTAAKVKAVADAGGSPRARIDVARSIPGNEGLVYLPHGGKRERERRLKQLARIREES